jgi:hypothetical protein
MRHSDVAWKFNPDASVHINDQGSFHIHLENLSRQQATPFEISLASLLNSARSLVFLILMSKSFHKKTLFNDLKIFIVSNLLFSLMREAKRFRQGSTKWLEKFLSKILVRFPSRADVTPVDCRIFWIELQPWRFYVQKVEGTTTRKTKQFCLSSPVSSQNNCNVIRRKISFFPFPRFLIWASWNIQLLGEHSGKRKKGFSRLTFRCYELRAVIVIVIIAKSSTDKARHDVTPSLLETFDAQVRVHKRENGPRSNLHAIIPTSLAARRPSTPVWVATRVMMWINGMSRWWWRC